MIEVMIISMIAMIVACFLIGICCLVGDIYNHGFHDRSPGDGYGQTKSKLSSSIKQGILCTLPCQTQILSDEEKQFSDASKIPYQRFQLDKGAIISL